MIRPVDLAPTQLYGDNPTSTIYPGSPDYWIIELYGNYQPDGHAGEDYPCKAGTPVRAVTDGTVLHIGRLGGTYAENPWWIAPGFAGYVAVIDHGAFIGIYGHCMDGSAKVRKGDRVTEGQVFVLSGNTGASTGDHLHFEILPDGYVLNSRMYGRIDPESLFAGITPQGTITPIQEDDMPSVSEVVQAVLYEPIPKYNQRGEEVGKTTLAESVAWQESNFYLGRQLTIDAIRETVLGVLTSPVPDVATGGTTNLATEVSWLPANFNREGGEVDLSALAESIATAVAGALTADKPEGESK